jgi:ABC-type antimicrobial peptide transport system permease subunit
LPTLASPENQAHFSRARHLIAFSTAAFVLIAAGVCATLLPAQRATRVDPMVALREP